MEYLSTTSLASELEVPVNELFGKFKTNGWIERKGDKWMLTNLGKQKGGLVRINPKFGEFIVWPANIKIDVAKDGNNSSLLSATVIGKHFKVSSQRLNLILSELGWIEKDVLGWKATKSGRNVGGKQLENETSGASYVLWPENILQNKSLNEVFNENDRNLNKDPEKSMVSSPVKESNPVPAQDDFRLKYEAKHRTLDGHYVRSKAEMIIDNALYQYKLVHAYERKLPIEEDVFSDFYIPAGPVYIEYWGMENDPKYNARKQKKIEIYKKHDLPLIELNDEEILNLDDHLPRKLSKFGIKVF